MIMLALRSFSEYTPEVERGVRLIPKRQEVAGFPWGQPVLAECDASDLRSDLASQDLKEEANMERRSFAVNLSDAGRS